MSTFAAKTVLWFAQHNTHFEDMSKCFCNQHALFMYKEQIIFKVHMT